MLCLTRIFSGESLHRPCALAAGLAVLQSIFSQASLCIGLVHWPQDSPYYKATQYRFSQASLCIGLVHWPQDSPYYKASQYCTLAKCL
jgi:hypothetical protein